MRNVFTALLCAALLVCFIWSCSLSGENAGLIREKQELSRKYTVLQLLYHQTQGELTQIQEKQAAEVIRWQETVDRIQSQIPASDQKEAPAEEEAVPEEEQEAATAPLVFTVQARETPDGTAVDPVPESDGDSSAPARTEETDEDLFSAPASAESDDASAQAAQEDVPEETEDVPTEEEEEIPLG